MILKNRKGEMGEFIPNLFLELLHKIIQVFLNANLGLFDYYHILLVMWRSFIVKKTMRLP